MTGTPGPQWVGAEPEAGLRRPLCPLRALTPMTWPANLPFCTWPPGDLVQPDDLRDVRDCDSSLRVSLELQTLVSNYPETLLHVTGHLNLTFPKQNHLAPLPALSPFSLWSPCVLLVADLEVSEASFLFFPHTPSSKSCWLNLQNTPESNPSCHWPVLGHLLPVPPSLHTLSILHTVARGTSGGFCALIPLRQPSHSELIPKCPVRPGSHPRSPPPCPLHPASPAMFPIKGPSTLAPQLRPHFPKCC